MVQGRQDFDKTMIVYSFLNLKKMSIHPIITNAAIMNPKIRAQDVVQTYFQSESHLTREVDVSPK